ncbi:cytochrome P450 [Aspergillus taichungensis]|uniref:Cytochrome P450 monooxygenase otaC n=1 Tax=Aspergillus taichungensis TaxID=482145 RepID=A0A2J5HSB2_9EURO|nr:cytochrome P450 [Aspergillus taichungensis]
MVFFEALGQFPVVTALTAIFAYLIACMVYRLYLSPVASFPGHPLAAITCYEFYYDAICGGQYIFKIKEMHKTYGPIIRINPEELHVETSEFYGKLYTSGREKRNKTLQFSRQLGTPNSTIGTIDHDLHRIRRSALSPFFSKASIRRLQPVIWAQVDILLKRLEEFKKSGRPLRIELAYFALTNDIIMEYSFNRSLRRLQKVDFDLPAKEALLAASKIVHWMKHFPWIIHVARLVPLWIMSWINPAVASLLEDDQKFAKDNMVQVHEIMNGTDRYNEHGHPTIFHEMISNPTLPDSEKGVFRLSEEAKIVVGAGSETTAWALSLITYHLLKQPHTLSRLRAELIASISDPQARVGIEGLEHLPYLTAVIQEGLRFSCGVTGRLARIAPEEVLIFHDSQRKKDWHIPAGTPVSMTSVFVHNDPAIFPEPTEFRPERWLEASKEGINLSRYLVSFTKGSRQCVGINLAYAELYICVSSIFRRYSGTKEDDSGKEGILNLFETSNDDVDIAADMFLPVVKKESKGIRLIVTDP